MRNYLYVSDSKVDMYLPQIAGAEKQKVSAKLGFDVKLLKGELGTERMSLENRIHRLAVVESEVRRTQSVGSPTKLGPWIEGTLRMTPAIFKKEPDLMFFFADNDKHFFGLSGSSHHIIGNVRPATATSGFSYLPSLLNTLTGIDGAYAGVITLKDESVDRFLHAGHHTVSERPWIRILENVSQHFAGDTSLLVSFLARRLVSEEFPKGGRRFTLASPLYMAHEVS